MECTFAINSTAPGFVLIQDEMNNKATIKEMERRNDSNAPKGFVTFQNMAQGEYSVEVYDQKRDYGNNQPAFRFEENVIIRTPWLKRW